MSSSRYKYELSLISPQSKYPSKVNVRSFSMLRCSKNETKPWCQTWALERRDMVISRREMNCVLVGLSSQNLVVLSSRSVQEERKLCVLAWVHALSTLQKWFSLPSLRSVLRVTVPIRITGDFYSYWWVGPTLGIPRPLVCRAINFEYFQTLSIESNV